MNCPPRGLGVRCSAPKLSGSGFEAASIRIVWPAFLYQASWQLAIEGRPRSRRTVSPSTCGTLNVGSKSYR